MGFIDSFKKNIRNLPSRLFPTSNSLYYSFMNDYGWSLTRANKNLGDLETYYNAYNNVYVKSCIKAYSKYSLINGFTITDKDNTEIDYISTNYLTHLFNDPSGKDNPDTFAVLNNQIWTSWKLTGDCFIEVNHDMNYGKIPVGFKHIPTELMLWDRETGQWGIRNTNKRFENDELIHIYDPSIRVKNYLWGVSEIDSIGLSIALEFQGMKHNRELFENSGIDPRGIISYDEKISNTSIEMNRRRVKESQNEKGLLFLKGATYQSTGNSNRDLDFHNLMLYARDRILVGFQVPPAIIGIIETASLGSGTGESQEKSFQKTLQGECKTVENAFNKCLGNSGFSEIFEYNSMDLENKLVRAQIEDLQVKNGLKSINEVRSGYSLEPVAWGDVPMNYGMFGVSNNSEDNPDVIPIGEQSIDDSVTKTDEIRLYQKALLLERLKEEY